MYLQFCVVSLLGGALGRPSLLGASQFPSFPRGARQGHSHHVTPLDGLYNAPPQELYGAPPPEIVEDTQPSYGLPPPPASVAAPAALLPVTVSAPAPAAAPMMMMDPSYSFQFSNEDSEREEANDISGVLTGSYSYKTPGGQDILVKYTAGSDTGFVIQNMEELNAALERSAAEPVEVRASPYSGETAEIEYTGPAVAADMSLEQGYSYGYRLSDKEVSQQADNQGEVTGSYSYSLEDGRKVEVKYTAGKDGFKVDNLEELLASVHPEEDLGPIVESQAAPAVVVARDQLDHNTDYQYEEAEQYVHDEIEAEPYLHVEIPAEVYVHDSTGDVGEPYVHQTGEHGRAVGRKRVQVNKVASSASSASSSSSAASRSFSFQTKGEDQEFTEQSDNEGERIGSYSYISPEGDKITVRYSAGRNGFVILNPEEVLPQPLL